MKSSAAGDGWRRVVEAALRRELDRPLSIRSMRRLPFSGSSSHRLEELRLVLADGGRLQLFAKEVGPAAAVKPAHLLNLEREARVYLQALRSARLGTARCYGVWAEPGRGRKWLLLEKAPGRELFQWGDLEVWRAASRWLARLHFKFAGCGSKFARRLRLLHLDEKHLLERMEAARLAVERDSSLDEADKEAFLGISRRYARWIDLSVAGLPTLLHGDFYPSNILVDWPDRNPGALRICPVDWEMASWGPGVADLAALTSGGWSPGQRGDLAAAYCDEAGRVGLSLPPGFAEALEAWRLHLAVRWVGWSSGWTPPPEQRRDWLAEALRIAETLPSD